MVGGFFLGNWAFCGRKNLKICALWGKDRFWYISVRTSRVKGEGDSALGICIIWSMASGVIVKRVSPDKETMAL
jgi:hypothetical protein